MGFGSWGFVSFPPEIDAFIKAESNKCLCDHDSSVGCPCSINGMRKIASHMIYIQNQAIISCHGYDFSILRNGNLWISYENGEGMELGKESIYKFWKENF